MLTRSHTFRACLLALGMLAGTWFGYASASEATRLGYWHYLGADAVWEQEGGNVFKSVFEAEASSPVKDLFIAKLAAAPDQLFYGLGSQPHPERVALLTPLWQDFLDHETYGEVHSAGTSAIGVSLGIKLPLETIQTWNAQLRRYAGSLGWEISPPLSEGMPAQWEATSTDSGFLMRFEKVGEWLLISVGADVLTQILDWGTKVEQGTFPPVAGDDQWGRLGIHFDRIAGLEEGAETPLVRFLEWAMVGDGDAIRTTGEIRLSQDLDDQAPEWSIPVNKIQEPIVSFSAQRDLTSLVTQLPGVRRLFPTDAPDQWVTWSMSSKVQNSKSGRYDFPLLRSYSAWPVSPGALSVSPLQEGIASSLGSTILENPRANLVGNPVANFLALKLQPAFVQPFLQGIEYEENTFHIAGLTFMMSNRTNPPPPSLFAQIERHPRLRYYHWELSGQQIYTYRVFLNFVGFLFGKGQILQDSPLFTWTTYLESRLGNSVTQLLKQSSNTLEIQRKSHLGLTGFEIALLSKWMHSKVFPWIDFEDLSQWEIAPITPTSN